MNREVSDGKIGEESSWHGQVERMGEHSLPRMAACAPGKGEEGRKAAIEVASLYRDGHQENRVGGQ